MAVIRTTVTPGNCGLKTRIFLNEGYSDQFDISVETYCDKVRALVDGIADIDPIIAATASFVANPVFQRASTCHLHAGCPIPTAIIKGMEVLCSMALPGRAEIDVTRD